LKNQRNIKNKIKEENMSILCELKLNNQNEIFEFEKVAKQANGSVLYKVNNTVILASIVSEFDNPVSEDFTPLTVQYIEKTYANAKINGGFIKREGKPSDFETLTSRIIDRSLRPLFPSGYVYPTTITVMVLSVDSDADLQVLALNAASAALYQSDLPIKKSVAAVRIAKINEELVVNPSLKEQEESVLDLFIAGTLDDLLMIEMKTIGSEEMIEADIESFIKVHNTNEMKEDILLEAISLASSTIKEVSTTYETAFTEIAKETMEVELKEFKIDKSVIDYVKETFYTEIREAVSKLAKSERSNSLKLITNNILNEDYAKTNELEFNTVFEAVNIIKKEIVRSMIIDENKRADGRGLKDVRPISIETNILPSAHSSCLFTRGETQALVVATLGNQKDGQMFERVTGKSTETENFMVHYNFPGFSVGEAKPIMGVSRRELGHGNLGKRALEPTIDVEYSDTIRLVSEILESNGSSSMATVCGGSLALKAAGIPISNLVAGVAMGGVIQDGKHVILTDIMGLEDHDGDMDFKVAGTSNGITAMQMDIKLGGIELDVLKEALEQAKDGREHILALMEDAANDIVVSDALPLVEQFKIDPKKIMVVIGKAGATIREIIEQFEVGIDLDRDNGNVKVTGSNKQKVLDACAHIKNISDNASVHHKKQIDFTKEYKVDESYEGKVERIVDFGAFVSLPKGGEGLLHISKISKKRVNKTSDVLSEGQMINVTVLETSKDRIALIATAAL
jgi:polyribonucleotide nucleotidyltransferase